MQIWQKRRTAVHTVSEMVWVAATASEVKETCVAPLICGLW